MGQNVLERMKQIGADKRIADFKVKQQNRFDRLRESNPKEWEFWMYRCCIDPETCEKFGWGKVLDYIGVPWEDEYKEIEQMSIFDMEAINQ